ncbi:hypothetical protein [Nocardiopsis suaedae]|uniref:Uncharacterized protein n=1 Tax=Nocardiopsis suaedae TaxID=3018444 RepID=A0ABT4TWA5_9ACTN|nr:hypothetical protein [Nocardiopsis suaedae]MDA2808975.1 hypothetical protein [Nocardiopsis suaedae]
MLCGHTADVRVDGSEFLLGRLTLENHVVGTAIGADWALEPTPAFEGGPAEGFTWAVALQDTPDLNGPVDDAVVVRDTIPDTVEVVGVPYRVHPTRCVPEEQDGSGAGAPGDHRAHPPFGAHRGPVPETVPPALERRHLGHNPRRGVQDGASVDNLPP